HENKIHKKKRGSCLVGPLGLFLFLEVTLLFSNFWNEHYNVIMFIFQLFNNNKHTHVMKKNKHENKIHKKKEGLSKKSCLVGPLGLFLFSEVTLLEYMFLAF
ncbi:hypothetical protein ACJX0J_037642, partial [Zea mays]